jgi:hypothetical protein
MGDRVSLVQEGTERILGPDREREVRREALESAATGLGLGSALAVSPLLAEVAFSKGVDRANRRATVAAADALYDALAAPGGMYHENAAKIGGDALSPRDSAKVLGKLGISYTPRANEHAVAARDALGAQPLVDKVDDLYYAALKNRKLPNATEIGAMRAGWAGDAAANFLNKDLPGWDRAGSLDRQDFRNIAKAMAAQQGGDFAGARAKMVNAFRPELAVAASDAGSFAAKRAQEAAELGNPRMARILAEEFPGLPQVRRAASFVRAPAPGVLAAAAKSPALAAALRAPLVRPFLSRGAALVPLAGVGAGLFGAASRAKSLKELEAQPRDPSSIEENLRAKDESTAMSLGRMFGEPTPTEDALGLVRKAQVSPQLVSDVTETAFALAPYLMGV